VRPQASRAAPRSRRDADRVLSLLEMKMAVAALLGGFHLDSVESADGGAVKEHLAFTMSPTPLVMRLSPR
jgi:hypothetical protein